MPRAALIKGNLFQRTEFATQPETLNAKALDIVSALEFMTEAEKADVRARTYAIDVDAALQDGFDALVATAIGGTLYCPEGGYSTANKLTCNSWPTAVPITLKGAGQTIFPTVVFKATGGVFTGDAMLEAINPGFSVDGIFFDCNHNAALSYGLHLDAYDGIGHGATPNPGNSFVKNVGVHHLDTAGAYGIALRHWDSQIDHCYIAGITKGCGIGLLKSNDSQRVPHQPRIDRCYIVNSEIGVQVDNGLLPTIQGCQIDSCRCAIWGRLATNLNVRDCYFEDIGADVDGTGAGVTCADFVWGYAPHAADNVEGPIALWGGVNKFEHCTFLYRSPVTDTAGKYGVFSTLNDAAPTNQRGVTRLILDQCEFEHLNQRLVFNSNGGGQTLLEMFDCTGLDSSQWRLCAYGRGTPAEMQNRWYGPGDQYQASEWRGASGYGQTNRIAYWDFAAGTPTYGSWEPGDMIKNTNCKTLGDFQFKYCKVAGTYTAIATTADTTNGLDTVTTAAEVPLNAYISIAGVTGTKKVIAKDNDNPLSITVDSVCDATVVAGAVANVAPTFANAYVTVA